MTPEEEIARANEAAFILENKMFKAAFADIEAAILSGIQRSAFVDEKLREKLCARYALLHDIRDQFVTHMETGKMAAEVIRQRSISERVRDGIKSVVNGDWR